MTKILPYNQSNRSFRWAADLTEIERRTMKNLLSFLAIAIMACAMGCESPTVSENSTDSPSDTKVSLEADLCGACGCCADCEDCCQGEKCECGMQKGTALCCSGVKPVEGVDYCKDCGFDKKSESCCAESNEECGKCGLAKGSPICCKVKAVDSEHEGHDHDGHDHSDHDHDESVAQ